MRNLLPLKISLLGLLFFWAGYFKTSAQCLLIPIPLEERVQKSTHVFEGEIVESEGFMNPSGKMIHTAFKVKVTRVFKGNDLTEEPFVAVYTMGGVYQNRGLNVNPSLNLAVGDKGLFIGSPDESMPTPYPELKTFSPFGTANGFIRYDLIDNSAGEAFYKYKEIEKDLYPQVERFCRQKSRFTAKLSRPEIQPAGDRTMVPMNITFTPATVTAGTFTQLTINGTGFTTLTGPAGVRFRNADDGGGTNVLIGVGNPHIVSWTNTQIVVNVPTRAGTGTIDVVDNTGAVGTSAATLNVSYALINAGSPANMRHQVLTDRNYAGGHTMSLNTTTGFAANAAAVASFRRALETWRCATRVNYVISPVTTTADFTNTADTINSVCFESNLTVMTALGICFTGWTFPFGCNIAPGGATGVKTYFDLVFRNPAPGPNNLLPNDWHFAVGAPPFNSFDFQSVALHELGHAHELAHVIDPAFEVMNFNIANGQSRRSIVGNATAAGNFVILRSTNVAAMNGCGQFPHQAIDPSICSQTTPPVASCGITPSITSGCSPLTVNFTGDAPGGLPSSWLWNINFNGDGSPPGPPVRTQIEYFVRNPSHTFTAPGTYVVKLYAGSASGWCNTTVTINVTGTFVANVTPINPPPACGSQLLTATFDVNFAYQWRRNGVNIPGAVNNTYTATTSGTYDVLITQGACSQIVGPTVVTINPATVGGTLSGGGAVCANGNSGTMVLTGFVGNILRWEVSTDNFGTITNIPNTTPTQNYNNIAVPTQYRVVVQSPGCTTEFSSVASFTVNPPTIPGTIAPVSVNGCAGLISGTLTLTGQQGNILRWESSVNGFGTITNIPNNTPNQTYSGLTVTTQFRAVVQNPGCAVLTSNIATVNVTPTPGSVGAISGPTVLCQNVVGNYNVMMVPNVIYDWSVSPAGPVISPSGPSATVNYSGAAQGTYTLTVTPRIGVCVGPPSSVSVFVQAVPATPGSINVPVQCINQSGFYSVPPVLGASTYVWTNSCGWSGTSTSSFINYVANTPGPCTITVQAFGPCGTTGIVSTNVTAIDIPAGVSPITGNTNVCNEVPEIYSVVNVPGVTYTWTGIPAGAFVTNGQGTHRLEMNWGTAAPGLYTLTVTPSNPCGNGIPQSLNVNLIGIPPQPGNITGNNRVCQNVPETFLVNLTPGVTYTWSVIPAGPTLIPSNNSVAFSSAVSGTYLLSVTQNSICGASAPSFLQIIVDPLRTANAGANRTVCGNNTILTGNPSGGTWNCVTCPGVNLTPAGSFAFITGMRPGVANVFRYAIPPNGSCPGSESFVTVTNANPAAGLISGPNSVCAGSNVTLNLTGSSGNVIRWEVSENNGQSFISLNNQTTTLNYVVTTNSQFRAIVGSGQCPSVISPPHPVLVSQEIQAEVETTNLTVCSNDVNIFAKNPIDNAEGVWTFVSGPATPNLTSSGIFGLVTGMTQPGVYRFRYTILNNPPCSPTSAETFVTRLAPTDQANGGSDQTICATQTTLTGNVPQNGTARWSQLSGPAPAVVSGNTTVTVTGMTAGVYVFEYKIDNPPCPSTIDQVIVTVIGGNQIANAGPDRSVCSDNASVRGSDPAPGTGNWTFVSGPANVLLTTVGRDGVITGMSLPGDYIFRWTVVSPQCGSTSDLVTLTKLQNGGIAQVAQPVVSVCGQAVTSINALPFGNGTANWSFVSGPSVATITTVNLTGNIAGMALPGNYVFRWTVTSNCGTTTADVTVRRDNPVPNAFAGSNQTVCNQQNALLNGNQPPVGATGIWSFVTGPAPASIATVGTFGSVVGMSLPGTYVFSWTIRSNNSCPNSTSIVSVTRVAPASVAIASSNQTVCGTNAIVTGNTPQFGTGQWSFISGPTAASISQQGTTGTVSGMNVPGQYRFRWTISNPPCVPSSADVVINSTPGTQPGTLAGGGTVCAGNNFGSLTLSGQQGTVVRWEISENDFGSFNIFVNNSATLNFSNLTRKTSYRAVVKNGTCPEAVSNIVTVEVTPETTPADAGPDRSVCANNITLTGNTPAGGTVNWQFLSGPVQPNVTVNQTTAIITGMNVSGDYFFRYQINNLPCGVSEDAVKIKVSGPTVAGTVSASRTYCSPVNSTTFNLTGNTGSVVRWESSENGFGTISPIGATSSSLRVDNVARTTSYRAVVKNGNCPAETTAPVTITIINGVTADAGTDQSLCGNRVTLTGTDPQGSTPAWTYVSGPNQPAMTQSGQTADVQGMIAGTYRFRYTLIFPGCAPSSDDVEVRISAPVNGGQISGTGSLNVCSGANTGTLVVTGFTGSIVRWERSTDSWRTVETILNPTAQFTFINLTQTTSFRAIAQSGACGEARSTDITVSVSSQPTQAIAGQAQTVCTGATVTLTGNVPMSGTPSWRFLSGPGSPIVVPSGSQATVTNLTVPGTYSFEYSIANPPCNASLSTTVINVAGSPNPGTASGNATVCAGTNNGAVTLTGQTGTVVRWERSEDDFNQNILTISNTTNVLGYVNLNTTVKFRAVVSRPGCPEVMSNAVTITVAQPSVGGSLQGSRNICFGNNTGSLTLTGNTGNAIRWELSNDNFATFNFIVATSNTFNYTNLTRTTQVRAAVQSGPCAAVRSSVAVLTVDPASVGGTVNGSTTICHGTNSGTLTLTGNVGNIVRWENSVDGGITFTSINNQSNVINYFNLTRSNVFRAVVKSGVCNEVVSVSANITINPNSEPGMLAGNTTVCGSPNQTVLSLNGNAGTIVRWEASTDNFVNATPITNNTGTYVVNNLTQSTRYRVAVQPSGGCPLTYSNVAEITVLPAVQAGFVSGPSAVCAPVNTGTLTLGGFVGNVVRWEFSSDNFQTFTVIPNTTPSFTFNNITQTLSFRVQVQNGSCPPAYSQVWTVTVGTATVAGTVSGAVGSCGVAAQGTLTLAGQNGNVLRWESSEDNFNTITTVNNTTASLTYDVIFTTKFRAVIQSPGCATVTTTPVTVTVDQLPSAGALYDPATVCYEQNGGTLYLLGTIGRILRWESSTDNFQTITTIPNTLSFLTYTGLTQTTKFRAVANTGGVCSDAYSNEIAITVRPQMVLQASFSIGCNGLGSVIARAEGGGGEYTYNIFPAVDVANTGGTFNNLTPNVYTITAVDEFNCSVSITVNVNGAPSAPQIASVTNITFSSATLSWQPVPPGVGVTYTLRYRILGSPTWTVINNINVTQYLLTALQNNTTYEIQLAYRCGPTAPLSDFSTGIVNQFTTLSGGTCSDTPVPVPGGMFVSNITANGVQVNWNAVSGASGYVVSFGPSNINPNLWQQIFVCHPNTSLLVGFLQANTTYRVRVRTNCTRCGVGVQGDRLSAWSINAEFTTPAIRHTDAVIGEEMVSVYPNPTNGTFNLTAPAGSTAELFDLSGRIVLRKVTESETTEIQTEDLAAGVYTLKVVTNGKVKVIKLVKE